MKSTFLGTLRLIMLASFMIFVSNVHNGIAQSIPGSLTETATYSTSISGQNGDCTRYITTYVWKFKDPAGNIHSFPGSTYYEYGDWSGSNKNNGCIQPLESSLDEWSTDNEYYLQARAGSGTITAVGGFLSPKYKVVGIAYTVPGTSSYIQYTDTTMMGTNTSLAGSFSTNVTTSASICGSTGSSVCGQGGGVSITGTYTNSFTQENDTSSSFAINHYCPVKS